MNTNKRTNSPRKNTSVNIYEYHANKKQQMMNGGADQRNSQSTDFDFRKKNPNIKNNQASAKPQPESATLKSENRGDESAKNRESQGSSGTNKM